MPLKNGGSYVEKDDRSRLLNVNVQQTEFYEKTQQERRLNPVMRLWEIPVRRMYLMMDDAGASSEIFSLQKEWIGDLSGKKVLDFGCYEGNVLSAYLASNAESYLGIDLSDRALQELRSTFDKRGISDARLRAVDILSDDFEERDFDLVYAQGVLHHFNPVSVVLSVLNDILVPGGRVVSFDPLQASLLTRGTRAVYHRFRSDKEWEWPFTKATFRNIKKYFRIQNVQGVVGYSKWAIPIGFFHGPTGLKAFRWLHAKDITLAKSENRHLWRCMHVAMCLKKP
jgi:SAM-dependent methyltransferase